MVASQRRADERGTGDGRSDACPRPAGGAELWSPLQTGPCVHLAAGVGRTGGAGSAYPGSARPPRLNRMGLFNGKKKADPISTRARALTAEIAALEAQIKELGTQMQQPPTRPRLR